MHAAAGDNVHVDFLRTNKVSWDIHRLLEKGRDHISQITLLSTDGLDETDLGTQQCRAWILGILERGVRVETEHQGRDIAILLRVSHHAFSRVATRVIDTTARHAELVQHA